MANSEDTQTALRDLKVELSAIGARQQTSESGQFTSWRSRTRSALTRSLGEGHHITTDFVALHWSSMAGFVTNDPAADELRWHKDAIESFQRAAHHADGYLEAAIAEMGLLAAHAGVFDATGVDPDLWAYIGNDVETEQWGQAATQAMVYVEDRIRRWTGQHAGFSGENLMTAVLGDKGNYRLGLTSGEQQGWHRLAMGMSMALRNAVAHRVQDRDDHRRYTLGVIGVGSLLLTQLRHEHSNRFHDTSPLPSNDSSPSPGPAATDLTDVRL